MTPLTVEKPLMVVVTGPTGSGKTSLAIDIARELRCDIVSADSRQLFADIPIGTAAPTARERAAVTHHLVGTLQLTDYYSAAAYADDAMAILARLWRERPVQVACGGSMLYVDALVNGIDALPTVSAEVRAEAYAILERGGIEAVRERLRRLDPDYYDRVDTNNAKRMVHAIEVTMQAGVPYSSLLTGGRGERKRPPFDVVKIAVDWPREQLFDRINRRVEQMVADGFLDEARRVYPMRHLNSLNTVGYKEAFAWLDGTMPLDTALARMAKNTRVYAKKQLTWLRRDPSVVWLDPARPLLPQAMENIPRDLF